MAKHADKYALLRSVYHTGAGVHDVGHQYMQTGRFFQFGNEQPHFGCVLSKLKGPKGDAPPHVLLPRPIGNTGGNLPHGQNAGLSRQDLRSVRAERRSVGRRFPGAGSAVARLPAADARRRPFLDAAARRQGRLAPRVGPGRAAARQQLPVGVPADVVRDRRATRSICRRRDDETKERYGRNRFGMSCLLARRMIERGVRFVTVNMFETVFNEITWDIHGSAPFSPISCYRDLVGPMFDHAYSSLLEDLHDRGLLQNTLVLAMGEFGRTPKVNPAGGRDHWTNCWTIADGRRRDQGRAGHRRVGRDWRRIRRTGRFRRRTSPRRSTRRSASTSRRRLSARRTGRCRSSTTAIIR